ncbi:MAG: YceI family protein [Proteobacteria bacterium]|nr:YceI family protein [Pseudomonadota bacterium]
MMRITIRILALILAMFASSVIAETSPWQIVSSESSITFTATQNGAPVTGKFSTFTGEINFDPAKLSTSSVRIIVDMNSVETSYKDVAETLKTSDWFNVNVFPKSVFTAKQFKKTGDNTYEADGELVIRDKKLPVTLTFVVEEFSNTKAREKGSTTLKRTQFGVGQGDWANTSEIKDDVQVNFVLTSVKK